MSMRRTTWKQAGHADLVLAAVAGFAGLVALVVAVFGAVLLLQR